MGYVSALIDPAIAQRAVVLAEILIGPRVDGGCGDEDSDMLGDTGSVLDPVSFRDLSDVTTVVSIHIGFFVLTICFKVSTRNPT